MKAESMEKDAGEKCDKMVADAEEEAKRKINAIQRKLMKDCRGREKVPCCSGRDEPHGCNDRPDPAEVFSIL